MHWLKNNPTKILLIVINTLLLTILMLSSYDVSSVPWGSFVLAGLETIVPILLICIGISGLLKEKKFLYLMLILVGIGVLFLTWNFSPERLGEDISKINMKLGTAENLTFSDFKFLIQTLGVFLTLICILSIYIYPWNIIITDIAFIFFLWAVDYLQKPGVRLLPFVFMWAFLMVHERALSQDYHFSGYKIKNFKVSSRMTQVLVISIIIGITTISLFTFNKGIYYDKLWVKANDFLMQDEFMAGNKFLNAFSLKNSGYNDSSEKLGGDIKLDNNVMVSISGDAPKYLRGNTKYQYTGNLWLKNGFIYRTENSASSDVTKSYAKAHVKTMKIHPEGIRTSSIFVPSYPKTVIIEDRRPDLKLYYSIKDQTFVLDNITTLPYEVSYYDETEVLAAVTEKDVPSYSEEMKIFLDVPETVTQRTKDLTLEITKNSKTNKEKIEAIKNYLGTNYKYTLTPGDTPDGEDFVDDFLFEKKEGYCVHFASSLTIMARIAGVPARYAEGYKVPEDKDANGNVIVKNEDAHAWTEVLVDPEHEVWSIVDATGSARDHSDDNNKEKEEKKKQALENTKPRTNPDTKPKKETKPNQNKDTKPEENKKTEENKNSFKIPPELLFVPLIILLVLLIMVIRKRIIIGRVLKNENTELLEYGLKISSLVGYPIKEKETYKEFLTSLKNQANESNIESVEVDAKDAGRIVNALEEVVDETRAFIYGGKEKTMSMEKKKDVLKSLYTILKDTKGSLVEFLRKYLI